MAELQDIKGIGNGVEAKLNESGISTVNELANASVEEIKEAGVRRAEILHERAEKQGVTIKSGTAVEAEQEETRYVSTGMERFDSMLDGGYEGGFIVGISGEHKAGKTQLVLQSLVGAVESTGDDAVYIETEPNRFHTDRVKTLCRDEDSYKDIYKIEAYSPDRSVDNLKLQKNSYDAVRENFDSVSMVAVDSFVANFRLSGRFQGREDLPDRNSVIGEHLQRLQALSNEMDCPVLLTLQIMGNPDMYSGNDIEVWGSRHMDHVLSYVIHMTRGKGEMREAHLRGHPAISDDFVDLKIPEDSPMESL